MTGPSSPEFRKKLKRYERSNDVRFLTFSTNGRLPLFRHDRIKDLFAERLAAARSKFGFHLYAWVVMPEHIHLLLWPLLPQFPVDNVLARLKSGFAQRVIARWRDLRATVLDRITERGWGGSFGSGNAAEDTTATSSRTRSSTRS